MVVMALILTVQANPSSVYACPIIAIALYYVKAAYLPASRQLNNMQLSSRSSLQATFAEAETGASCFCTYQWQDVYLSNVLAAVDRQQKIFYYKATLEQSLALVVGGFLTACFGIFWAGALNEHASPAAMGIALVACIYAEAELRHVLKFWLIMDEGMATLDEMRQVILMKPDRRLEAEQQAGQEQPLDEDAGDNVTEPATVMGTHELENQATAVEGSTEIHPDGRRVDEVPEDMAPGTPAIGPSPLVNWPSTGIIEFENVSIWYK